MHCTVCIGVEMTAWYIFFIEQCREDCLPHSGQLYHLSQMVKEHR